MDLKAKRWKDYRYVNYLKLFRLIKFIMHTSQSPSPQLGKSTYSSGARRDVLWNVVEPGDPYDIRKSMIAKLPGDRDHFMGDNLEIVCLLQSAEIERLCQFLDDYKFRYRDIERRELDRHSYEIQIKQLTQKLIDQGGFKAENSKLKDFIKKQANEIDELKNNRHNVDNNLRANYESALAQIEALINQNNFLKSEKDSFLLQINNYAIRIEAFETAKERQLRQVYNKYAEQNKYALEAETKSLKARYESEINRLELEIKRLKEFNDTKNAEINDLNSKNRSLLQEIDELSSKKGKPDPAYLSQMEQRFALMGQQIERLNLRIRESTSKIDEASRNELYWKDKYTRMEQDYKSLQRRYKESGDQIKSLMAQVDKSKSSTALGSNQSAKYEEQIRQLNIELQRLEDQRVSDSQRYNLLQKQYSQLEYSSSKISLMERENSELKKDLANVQQLRRKVAEYETKIALFSQQIQRLTSQSKVSSSSKQGYDQLRSDYDEFKRKSLEKQRNITQRYESEMQKKVLQYESRLAKYAEDSGNEFQMRLQSINREVERLNQYLKQKTEESELNKKRIRDLENSINQKYEIEATRTNSSYEITIKELKSQNQELNRRFRDYENVNRKIAEYENKLALLTQELERITYQLKMKTDEVQTLKRTPQIQPSGARPSSNIPDMQTSRKISMLEETQFKMTRENQDLKRRLQQIVELNRRVKQYEDRFKIMGQQNERLNQIIKQKVDTANRGESNLRNLTQQLEMLRRNKLEVESSFSQRMEHDKMETSRKFSSYEQSLSAIQREYDEVRRRMMDMGNDSNRKVSEYENRIVLLTQQLQRLNQTLKIKISEYESVIQGQRNELELSKRENRELQVNITQKYELETSRKIGIYEQNMSGLSRELEDLRRKINQYENLLRRKGEEVNQLENRYRVVTQEYESYKHQVKSFEGQVNRSQSSYEQNMTRLTRQYEDLKRKIAEYENKIVLLSQQNERVNGMVRNGQQEQETLRRQINQMRIEITQKYELETSRKISTYEQNMGLINKERQELRRKIHEFENMIANLNREMQNRSRQLVEWENKYRQVTSQKQNISKQYRELQVTVTQKYEVETSRKITIYEQNIQNMNRELENFKLKINQYENIRINYEKEINRLNGVLKNSEQVGKNQGSELEELRRRLKEFGDVHRAIAEYETRFALLGQEHERVNMNLKNKMEEGNILETKLRTVIQQNQELKRRIKEVEISIVNKYQLEINQKSSVFQQNLGNVRREGEELRRKIAELENRIALMTQEIERLNNNLRMKVDELNQSEMRGRNWQQQIENYKRRIPELQKSSSLRIQSEVQRTVALYEQNMTVVSREYEQYKRNSSRTIAQFETKIALLSQQLERASQALRVKADQLGQADMRVRNSIQEIQKLQRSIKQLEVSANRKLDNEKNTIISTYQQNMTVITRQYEEYKIESSRKYGDYENKLTQVTRELERVNQNLRKKVEDGNNLERRIMQLTQEIQGLRRQIKQNQVTFNQRYELELNKKVSAYETNFSTMKNDLQSLNRRNQELQKKIAEDENKIALMNQQIERLNQVLKGKVDQSKHYQSQAQKFANEIQNLKSNIASYYTTQIEKLNGIIKQRTEQYQILQQKFSMLQLGQDAQFKQLQSSHSLITKEYENSKKHLTEYEQSIRKLYSEFERLQVIINELKVQRQTLFDKNHGLIKQIERLTVENKDQETQLYEIRLKLSDEIALQKRINEHMALMVVLFAEIETLRERVKAKQKEVQEVRRSSLAPLKA